MSIAVFTLMFMVATAAWNIFSGYSGYLALGHAVFFGVGGYAIALAAQDWHVTAGWPTCALLPFAGLVAALVAIPVGLIALRTRRHTFVVVTIAIFFIFQTGDLQPLVHRRHLRHPVALRPVQRPTTSRFYYVALVIVVAHRGDVLGGPPFAVRAYSCSRSATTRTVRAASASRPGA